MSDDGPRGPKGSEPQSADHEAEAHPPRVALRAAAWAAARHGSPNGEGYFCSYCGRPDGSTDAEVAGNCDCCAVGMLLRARADSRPLRDDAFLVVNDTMVWTISRGAEALLGLAEEHWVGVPLDGFLCSAPEGAQLVRAIARCIGSGRVETLEVHAVAALPEARYSARISPCGLPDAALVLLLPAND